MNAYLSECHAECRSIVVSGADTIDAVARCLYMRLNTKVDAATLVEVIGRRQTRPDDEAPPNQG
jgi:hypothetical protein